ncbi:MlaD family protein [Sciscionella marina]|uniref:MlaD family protein n=1 Tax=Sciscionella marina TaxID=508770 RepID=UPI00058EE2EB|nr:MlaD family protein [Sciscionella marina]
MKVRVSKARGRSWLVGVALLAVVVACGYVALTAGSGPPAQEHTRITVAFADVGQLDTGADVRRNSVRIGQVQQIRHSGDQALVTMDLHGDYAVYRNARAAMWDVNALGQKFVELEPGSPGSGRLGDRTVPRTQTASATDIDQLLDTFDPKTRDATRSAVRELGSGVAGQSVQLHDFLTSAPGVLTDVGAIAGTLGSRDADLPSLLASANRLSTTLVGRTPQLRDLLRRATTTLQAVNVDGGRPLGDTVSGLPDTLTDVRRIAGTLHGPLDDTRSAVTGLAPGIRSLAAATPDLRAVLAHGVTPLRKVPGVATAANPAVQGLTTTLHDARPVVPRVTAALSSANPFLAALAPYSVDLPTLAARGANFANGRYYDKQGLVFGYVHIFPVVSAGSVAGLTQQGYNPYPAPGTADQDGAGRPYNPLGGGR